MSNEVFYKKRSLKSHHDLVSPACRLFGQLSPRKHIFRFSQQKKLMSSDSFSKNPQNVKTSSQCIKTCNTAEDFQNKVHNIKTFLASPHGRTFILDINTKTRQNNILD